MVEDRGSGAPASGLGGEQRGAGEAPRVGVLWDMDGTLVDTEPLWIRAETALVESYGGVWTHEQAMLCVGSGLLDAARVIQGAGVRMTEHEITDWLTDHVTAHLDPAAMPWRPGARELLASLRDAGIPSALVTMSYRRMALGIAGAIGFDAFAAVIAGDDVTNAKPHPEPYLTGAAALGLPIEACLALEDSRIGLGSAVASGAAVVAVPFLLEIPDSPDYAKWETLAGRTAEDVVAHLAARRTDARGAAV